MRKVALVLVTFGLVVLGACGSDKKAATPSTAPITSAPTTTTSTTRPVPSTTKPPATQPPAPQPTAPPPPPATTPPAPNLAALGLQLQPVVSGLSSPVAIAFRPGAAGGPGTMYVVEQRGTLRLVENGQAAATPALDLRANLSTGNEQGFLGAAFSADGKRLYVDYTDANGDTNVDEYTMLARFADARSRRRVLFVDQPYANHNGGEVVFGTDGELYVGLGDGGSAGDPQDHGQDLGTPLAKILRINPRASSRASYSVPADNPFVGQAGAFPETWAYGLRNPWRFTFDRETGDMWIGDVGQNAYEEIDFAPGNPGGVNWGWDEREGLHQFEGALPSGARDPIVETSHDDGWCAIVGGYVYRGQAIPALRGVYLFGDNCRSGIEGLVQQDGHVTARADLGIPVEQLTTFGEDGTGELYVAARGGTVSRITGG